VSFEGLILVTVATFILLGVVLFRCCFKNLEGKRWRYTLVVAHTIIILMIFIYMFLYGGDAQSGLMGV